jgi:hypothetical protein
MGRFLFFHPFHLTLVPLYKVINKRYDIVPSSFKSLSAFAVAGFASASVAQITTIITTTTTR